MVDVDHNAESITLPAAPLRGRLWKRALAKRDEIRSNAALRWYGAALTATHLFTLIYFARNDYLARTITSRDAVCWPFLPGCDDWRGHSVTAVHASMFAYGLVAVVTAVCFVRRAHVGKALIGLALLDLLKAVWVLHDYRLMGNYHYMPFIMTSVFLLVPDSKHVCRYLVVAFYVSAGVLKLNAEWLSGAALIAPTWLTGRWLEVGCAAVVVLELVISLGLLARGKLRWCAFAAFAGFHLYSWHVVGFFYPMVMFALLAIFPLVWLFERHAAADGLGERLLRRRAGWPAYAVLGVYAAAQLAPLGFPGDTAITGEGRIFAINMMDARVACDHFAVTRSDGGWREISDLRPKVGVRIKCDPIRYVSLAREACARHGDVSSYLVAKRTTDEQYQRVFGVEDACAIRFSIWAHNDWIGGP
jgi:hypothetical protein